MWDGPGRVRRGGGFYYPVSMDRDNTPHGFLRGNKQGLDTLFLWEGKSR